MSIIELQRLVNKLTEKTEIQPVGDIVWEACPGINSEEIPKGHIGQILISKVAKPLNQLRREDYNHTGQWLTYEEALSIYGSNINRSSQLRMCDDCKKILEK